MPKKTKKATKKSEHKNPEKLEENEDILDDISEDILAAWEFSEFTKHEKGKLWYIIFAILILAMLTYSYLTNNLLFAIILIIFTVLYFISDRSTPKIIRTAILEDGIFIDERFIKYEDLRSFYIIYQPPEIKNLYFETKSITKHRLSIPLERISVSLENQDPNYIREVLLNYLDEDLEKEEIPTSESVSDILKL